MLSTLPIIVLSLLFEFLKKNDYKNLMFCSKFFLALGKKDLREKLAEWHISNPFFKFMDKLFDLTGERYIRDFEYCGSISSIDRTDFFLRENSKLFDFNEDIQEITALRIINHQDLAFILSKKQRLPICICYRGRSCYKSVIRSKLSGQMFLIGYCCKQFFDLNYKCRICKSRMSQVHLYHKRCENKDIEIKPIIQFESTSKQEIEFVNGIYKVQMTTLILASKDRIKYGQNKLDEICYFKWNKKMKIKFRYDSYSSKFLPKHCQIVQVKYFVGKEEFIILLDENEDIIEFKTKGVEYQFKEKPWTLTIGSKVREIKTEHKKKVIRMKMIKYLLQMRLITLPSFKPKVYDPEEYEWK